MKAIGVHVRAPRIPKNLLMLSPMSIVKTTVKATRSVLDKFFVHYLFFVLAQEL